jgi:pimeloyl-ACP methyl ester carboxylesterase
MSSLVLERVGEGQGPTVVLVHGVGLGPATFRPLAVLLTEAERSVVVVHRPGHGLAADRPFVPLDDQVDDLAAEVARLRRSGPVAGVVGVSGGATLAVLLAIRLALGARVVPAGVAEPADVADDPVPVVAHEPLIGPLAPELHRRVVRALADLRGPDGAGAGAAAGGRAERFVRRLVGEATWSRLDPALRVPVAERPQLLLTEAQAFARVAPSAGDLAAVRARGRLITTVGVHSRIDRWLAASTLAGLAGAGVIGVPGAGHLAHLDAPVAFARLVLAATAAMSSPAGVGP